MIKVNAKYKLNREKESEPKKKKNRQTDCVHTVKGTTTTTTD